MLNAYGMQLLCISVCKSTIFGWKTTNLARGGAPLQLSALHDPWDPGGVQNDPRFFNLFGKYPVPALHWCCV